MTRFTAVHGSVEAATAHNDDLLWTTERIMVSGLNMPVNQAAMPQTPSNQSVSAMAL